MNLYLSIAKDIKKLIIENSVPSGGKLPSINSLSKKYECSKGTIIKAYDTLCKEHLIYSTPQSGYYVVNNLVHGKKANSSVYNLSSGNPTINSTPIHEIKHCLNTAIDLYSTSSLEIGPNGSPSLNRILPEHLSKHHIYANEKNINLTQGILQVLTILTQMPFPNGRDTILIEDPSYSFYIDFLKLEKCKVKTINRTESGINLIELENIFKTEEIKFFYTIPRNHNPLGTYYTAKQRQGIIELAKKYNVYVVEDDYFADGCELSRYSPIYYYSDFRNCIYLKSYSKIIPYIRIGLAIIPDDLEAVYFEWTKYSYYYSYYMPSLVSQATLESYIRSSLYDKHTNFISSNLKEKLKIIQNATKNWDQSIVKVIGAKSGYYTTLQLTKNINCDELLANLKDKNILLKSNIKDFYDCKNFNNSIRISVARINKEDLDAVLKVIHEEILKLN